MSVKIINGKDILNLIANEHPYAHVHVDALNTTIYYCDGKKGLNESWFDDDEVNGFIEMDCETDGTVNSSGYSSDEAYGAVSEGLLEDSIEGYFIGKDLYIVPVGRGYCSTNSTVTPDHQPIVELTQKLPKKITKYRATGSYEITYLESGCSGYNVKMYINHKSSEWVSWFLVREGMYETLNQAYSAALEYATFLSCYLQGNIDDVEKISDNHARKSAIRFMNNVTPRFF